MESLRALASAFAALVNTRAELALVELREEAERRRDMAVLAAAAGVFLALAAMGFAVFVVVLFWDTHRIAAAGAMTALYLAIGLFALWRLAKLRASAPPPFEATLTELARDVEALKGRHE